MRINFTTTIVFIIFISSPGHAYAYCPKFPTAATLFIKIGRRMVLISNVADSSLKSTKDYRLNNYTKYLILNRYMLHQYIVDLFT